MANTRKIVAEFAGVFLIGVAVGILVSNCFTDTQLVTVMAHWNDPDTLQAHIEARYVKDYQLTPDEMNKIKPLTKQLAQDLYKIRHQFALDVMGTLARDHNAIAKQLTPEHRAAYEAKMAERNTQLESVLLGDQSSPTPASK
jgi:quinol monooxygenase YgiN